MKTVDLVTSRLKCANAFNTLDKKQVSCWVKLDGKTFMHLLFKYTHWTAIDSEILAFGERCALEILKRTMDRMVDDEHLDAVLK